MGFRHFAEKKTDFVRVSTCWIEKKSFLLVLLPFLFLRSIPVAEFGLLGS